MIVTPRPSGFETVHLDDLVIDVPSYLEEQLPNDHCARYARLSAGVIFGLNFPVADAWRMRKNRKIFTIPTDNSDFLHLVQLGVIKPGMIIGVYCNDTEHNDGSRPYTHTSLYLGNQFNTPVFLEQFDDEIRMMRLRDYDRHGLQIREILGLR